MYKAIYHGAFIHHCVSPSTAVNDAICADLYSITQLNNELLHQAYRLSSLWSLFQPASGSHTVCEMNERCWRLHGFSAWAKFWVTTATLFERSQHFDGVGWILKLKNNVQIVWLHWQRFSHTSWMNYSETYQKMHPNSRSNKLCRKRPDQSSNNHHAFMLGNRLLPLSSSSRD